MPRRPDLTDAPIRLFKTLTPAAEDRRAVRLLFFIRSDYA